MQPQNQSTENLKLRSQTQHKTINTRLSQQPYKYLSLINTAFVVIILLSNLIASIKVTQLDIWGFKLSFTAGLIFFPALYLIGNLLTEVYGYSASRKVIWTGFVSLIISNLLVQVLVALPPAPGWGLQEAYNSIFALSLKVSLASMLAFFIGEFANSYTLAKIKLLTKGKFQSFRIITSTVIGEFFDTIIFYPLAFLGNENFPLNLLISIMLTNYIIKILWEILVYPITRQLIRRLKAKENEDFYDYNTNFNPFHLK